MADNYYLRLTKVTGTIILANQSTKAYTGTPEELADAYKKVRNYNLAFGWWGIVAIVWNIMAMIRNAQNYKKLQEISSQNATKAPQE